MHFKLLIEAKQDSNNPGRMETMFGVDSACPKEIARDILAALFMKHPDIHIIVKEAIEYAETNPNIPMEDKEEEG